MTSKEPLEVQVAVPAGAAKIVAKPKDRKILPRDLGLKVMFQPQEAEEIEIDVVAVHGMGANPGYTWTAGLKEQKPVNWLSDKTMLPKDLSKARIMTYGYQSCWFGEQAVRQSLENVATKLLKSLCEERSKCLYRPVIFIGHCFGGLVIQYAYTTSALHKTQFPGISDSVVGMVFLGTPHFGLKENSQLQTQGSVYNAIVEATQSVQANLLHTMAQDNDLLVNTVSDFTRKVNEPNGPTLYCFYEQGASNLGRIAGIDGLKRELFVNQSSGTLPGHQSEGLALDHFAMNKFEDSEDDNYKSVRRQIKNMVSKSKALMESRGLEYAHRFYEESGCSNVLWVNAATAAEFELSYIRIAESLGLTKNRKNGSVLKAVYDRLNQEGRWLMILDGLEDMTNLKASECLHAGKSLLTFIPKAHFARILITTRDKALAMRMVNQDAQYVINVSTLKDDDASCLLLGKVTSDSHRRESSLKVAKDLGTSAGTIVLAHIYRKMVDISCTKYRELLSSRQTPGTTTSGLLRASRLLYEALRKDHPSAAHLLFVIGSIDVQSIPEIFFERQQLSRGSLVELVRFGMVEPSKDKRVYCMTSVVRRCVETWLVEENEKELTETKVLFTMCQRFKANKDDLANCQVLLPCALAALKFQPSSSEAKQHLTTLLYEVSRYYQRFKQYSSALECLERCLALQQQDLQSEKDLVKKTIQSIEDVKKALLKNKTSTRAALKPDTPETRIANSRKEAEELKGSVGQDHPDTIRKISEMATFQIIHGDKKDASEALNHYKQVLKWCKAKYGDESMDAARRQYNLAIAHEAHGQYDEATKLYIKASKITERHLGPGHPELLRILGNVATLYAQQGHMEQARQAFDDVLRGQQEKLGLDHPDTLVTRQNVAMVLEEMGDFETAAEELRKVFTVQARLLGRDNRATLRTACSLAANHGLRGSLEDSEKLFKDTLAIQRIILGEKDRDTFQTEQMMAEFGLKAVKQK
ncbi:hypothetical protein TruAng_010242 [Truncatella angustata]|nr:hypothetical protein TruAng_010242 [Truncatella angustata]